MGYGAAQPLIEPPKWLGKCLVQEAALVKAATALKFSSNMTSFHKRATSLSNRWNEYESARTDLERCKNKNGGEGSLKDFFSYVPTTGDSRYNVLPEIEHMTGFRRAAITQPASDWSVNGEALAKTGATFTLAVGTLAALYLCKGKPFAVRGLATRGLTAALALGSSASIFSAVNLNKSKNA